MKGTCRQPRNVRKKAMGLRSLLAPAVFLLLFCAMLGAGQEKSETGSLILRQEMKWTEAYKQRNINILSSLLAEDFVITIEDGSVYSKAGTLRTARTPQFTWRLRSFPTSRFACMETRPS